MSYQTSYFDEDRTKWSVTVAITHSNGESVPFATNYETNSLREAQREVQRLAEDMAARHRANGGTATVHGVDGDDSKLVKFDHGVTARFDIGMALPANTVWGQINYAISQAAAKAAKANR